MAKMIIVAALSLTTVFGQAPSDLERRVAELEEKLRQIDPAFGKDATAQKPPQQALVTVSTSGDTQTSPSGETRLPVAGYMEFHVNKDSGDPFRPEQRLQICAHRASPLG